MSKKMGRPSDYKPEYCEMLIEHMSKGLSKLYTHGKNNIQTFYRQRKRVKVKLFYSGRS
jgi:hypothetical protein